MAVEIKMPQLSDTMSNGKILSWLKKEGDKISRGDTLAEVATDKADLEIESFHEGTLLKINADVGQTVNVGEVIAFIGEAGEKPVASEAPKPQAAPAPQAPTAQTAAPVSVPAPQPHSNGFSTDFAGGQEERIKISPLAKNLAQVHSVDYSSLQGSGEGGRIVKKDIELAAGKTSTQPIQTSTPAPAPQAAKMERPVITPQPIPQGAGKEPLSRMRETISARMVESTTTIPHFYVTVKICVDALAKMRESLKTLPQYEGITYNHLIMKGVGLALRKVPRINASFADGHIVQPAQVNVGFVTAIPDGLMIPIIKNTDSTPLADIVQEARGAVQRVRAGRPKGDDLSGGTFTISNMGTFSVESFTAIISPGQGAILAVSSIEDEPVVVDGQVKAGKVMRLTLSSDHRIIDGVVAGEFLKYLKGLLEDPILLLA